MSNNVPAIAFFELTDVEAGLSLEILSHATGIDGASLQPVLQTLKRHDAIEEIDGRYRITVELFRRWVLQLTVTSDQ
ncbi:hypothetical protein F7734_46590 [Scytonema sp. UIC 10036]|uniref:hypothetical protein n=1 Tax=Scytonema sp. UIC 10036 TaxID=2304196 RepID=UPI0012DA80DA|nr:hypothetical protein [Scytonema sp. UIC 10036]MUG99363.1 hypothetical protein [Scytonema sp. UIC 10036]